MGTVVALSEESLTLDDGTGTIVVHCPNLEKKGSVGETVDCAAWIGSGGDATTLSLTADYIIWGIHANTEALRWCQLADDNSAEQRLTNAWGYPCKPLSKSYLCYLIATSGGGATLEELALVVDSTPESIEPMIQELQSEGAIYQNRKGDYVPL
eukprot:CAMPEP_0116834702 /NCGR_PEP_ID=MMETSP0418-20121206/7133_1 /TAXON_ID=1158023 /ORGANISM="Astrosyne radiata, Strain 13vi08-1A" /LENGTH=153 /DNA_ID=CAMNT_0004464281 /DNA_START=1 /DNA_END=462 /DNA_ORIENTATION=+